MVPSYSRSLSIIFQPSSKELPQSYLRTTPVYTWRAVPLMPSPAHLYTCALDAAHKWLLDSGLQLNVRKTKCMLVSSNWRKSVPPLNVQLDDAHIEQVSTYKFLGVMVNQSLSWINHIDLVSSRVSKGLSLFRRIAWFLLRHVLCSFYKGYFTTHDVCGYCLGILHTGRG